MVLPIVKYGTPVLRQKGAPIASRTDQIDQLIADMFETMYANKGIGLAAQQVGHAIQLCVVDLRGADARFTWELDGAKPPLELIMPMTLANPVITAVPGTEVTRYEEGCLSFPGIRGDVLRPDAIRVSFQDERGTPHQLACDGLFARCIQHEADHLNGVLFIERMEKKVRTGIDDAVKALAKETKAAGRK